MIFEGLGEPRGRLGASWGRFSASWRWSGACWESLGASWRRHGASCKHLERILGAFLGCLERNPGESTKMYKNARNMHDF